MITGTKQEQDDTDRQKSLGVLDPIDIDLGCVLDDG